jgi:iron complex outermembrane receptor protein
MARTIFLRQKTRRSALTPVALAAALGCFSYGSALAQSASAGVITITGQSPGKVGVAGFGDIPLASSPLQASVYGSAQLADNGIASVGGLTRLDASLGDAYNADGYYSIISARGYTLDNRFNYRRDGLPINAETALAFDNKDRVEVLKGASGIQAGTSSPGGLVNLVVKRPAGTVRGARIEAKQAGSVLAAVDLGERFGADGAFGLRLNAAVEHLNPMQRNTQGRRSLFALAGDWQLGADTLLQAEFESSRQTQPSVAGFSMLGNSVPDARSIDPRINLNDQPWRQPVVLNGETASIKLTQRLNSDWKATVHGMQQRLHSDDRTAFPYGVYDPATYDCPQWCDRYAPDGTFTYWEFVSDNERRTSQALSFAVSGQVRTAGVEHNIETGVLATRYTGRFQDQVFDIAGLGKIDGSLVSPPSPGTPDANTNRDERSTEFFVRDAMRINAGWQLWAGLRHTRIDREAQRTSADGNGSLRRTQYAQALTTPWLALAYELTPRTTAYASWGQGMESDVAPNRARYTNAGQALPALKSRQSEVGVKHEGQAIAASLALFDINRPQSADIGACSAANSCTRQIDGSAHHKGIEAAATWRLADWTLQGSAMGLQAQSEGSAQAGVNGTRPVNVPRATLRLGGEYRLPVRPALALQANMTAESDRQVLPYDTSVRIAGWAKLDLGARWLQKLNGSTLTWRLGLDNATNQRAWKESPYQFGHVYLYPLAPRTFRASLQVAI